MSEVDGEELMERARGEKMRITRFRESLQILGTLAVIGGFVLYALFGTSQVDMSEEPALRIQLWCEGFAVGITDAVVRQGFQPPYEDDWVRLIGQCHEGQIYLAPYVVQPGQSPPDGQASLYADLVPPEPESTTQCIPTIARQC